MSVPRPGYRQKCADGPVSTRSVLHELGGEKAIRQLVGRNLRGGRLTTEKLAPVVDDGRGGSVAFRRLD